MPAKKTTKKLGSVKPKKEANYKLEISVNDLTLTGKGSSFEEALRKVMAEYPLVAKTRVLIKYTNGKNERSRLYTAVQGNRIFKRLSLIPTEVALLAERLEHELTA